MRCTERPKAGTLMSAACDECGHTVMLHPSTANPAVVECLVCCVEAMLEGAS